MGKMYAELAYQFIHKHVRKAYRTSSALNSWSKHCARRERTWEQENVTRRIFLVRLTCTRFPFSDLSDIDPCCLSYDTAEALIFQIACDAHPLTVSPVPRPHVKTEEGSGPGCVSVRRDVGVPVIAIMTVYDVSAAQFFECWHGFHSTGAAARVPSRAATHDVTEKEVTDWEK